MTIYIFSNLTKVISLINKNENNIVNLNMTDYIYHAPSWDDLLHDVRTLPTNPKWRKCASKGTHDDEWYGFIGK